MSSSSPAPPAVDSNLLGRRLVWLTGGRVVVLSGLLVLMVFFYLRKQFDPSFFSVQLALLTVAAALLTSAGYALLLRQGRMLPLLADVQIVLDQFTWTVVVYLTGGAASGATSVYGLTCVAGAVLTGLRGAGLAAAAAGSFYLTLVLGLHSKLIPSPPDQPGQIYALGADELVFHIVVNALVLTVVTLLAGYLAERLRATGGQLVVAEERAEKAERMAALGRLAAGLAHEIRNPLGSIAGSIQLLQTSPVLAGEDKQLCEIVQREAARLNDLVTDMMDLAKPRKPNPQVVDLARLVREVVDLASTSGRAVSDVAVRFDGPETVHIRADGSQLRQLVWNLVRNAVQASSAGDEVLVELRQEPDESFTLSVRDQGVGLDVESIEKLFDAFFTTRTHGTGIGLAVVKRIADDHGFSIDVESEPGQGATFHVRLGRETKELDAALYEPSPASLMGERSLR